MRLAPGSGEAAKASEFGDRNRLERMPVRNARSGLYLNEDDLGILVGDDVDLSVRAPPVALENPVAGCGQMVSS
jgi:hypothetical protein